MNVLTGPCLKRRINNIGMLRPAAVFRRLTDILIIPSDAWLSWVRMFHKVRKFYGYSDYS